MAFFTLAQRDGTIDKNIKMTAKEYEMALLGLIQNSNAWERHRATHAGTHSIVPRVGEESDFDKKVRGNKAPTLEPVQYDQNTKHFTAGCQCGQEFDIDPRNQVVSEFNPMSRFKEMEGEGQSYSKRDDGRNSSGSYGGARNNAPQNTYGMNNVPQQRQKRNAYSVNVSGGYNQ